jgi:hypothetical protein
MHLSQLTLVDFTSERILELQESLALQFNDTRALPRAAHEKVVEAKKRIELYKVMNPDVDVQLPASLVGGDDVRRATSDRAAVTDNGRAVASEDGRPQQQQQQPQQPARGAAQQLAQDGVTVLFDRFTDDYRRYWNSLTPDMRESIEDDLYHAV